MKKKVQPQNNPIATAEKKTAVKNTSNRDNTELSEREIEILQYLANGLSSKAIADKLFISFNTVESHRKSIYKKLGVNSAGEATAAGIRRKIIE